ncbi:hypothetical protein DMB92_08525 [Campylobacter sp. MIT 99-7217]|uniref:hypothetical protein n=1 Tax=Campylobacter sp. MIT 99-7217 TaxID=535091 RepID=UPI00115BA6C9|nr:hypothetical protein [Campylobacter sp. MIT 99-7217]TQR29172.1 hypothetical protein DMB92_08525 [Campylobacter sp. MIT 99-7217]
MNAKQARLRKQLLAKIHMHKGYKEHIQTNSWQDFLSLTFKTTSSKDLSIDELKICLDILDGKLENFLYLEPDIKGRALLYQKDSTLKQRAYLLALLELADIKYLNFLLLCKKTLKKVVLSLDELSKKDYNTMIYVLEKIVAVKKN